MSTEALEKEASLSGEHGEKSYTPDEEIVGQAMGQIFNMSPMKLGHEDLPSSLKKVMSPKFDNFE